MKKSLLALALALAVLGTFAGAASAQSSVTIYGKLDLSVAKPVGSADKQIKDQGGSRLGFRGVEDLGGGMSALFNIEHRFNPDTGAVNDATAFWNGLATVGLKGGFGTVNLGRQYTPAFSLIQNQIDPFGGDTEGAVRGVGMMTASGSVAKNRVTDSIRYDFGSAGFNIAASVAEAAQTGTANAGPDRPFSIAANYSAGPLFVGIGYENPANANDKLLNLGAAYTFGPAKLSAGVSKGDTTAGASTRSWLVGMNLKVGTGDFKVGVAQRKTAGTTVNQKLGVGYHHNLSKRTKLYADVGHDSKLTANKTGYDFGIQHNF